MSESSKNLWSCVKFGNDDWYEAPHKSHKRVIKRLYKERKEIICMTVKVRRQKLLDGVGEISIGKDVVVQLLSRVRLFATPWTAARQVSLSFTISWSFAQAHVPLWLRQ